MSEKAGSALLKIRSLPLDGQATALNEGDFTQLLRDACVDLFGNVSGLIDFDVVKTEQNRLILKSKKGDVESAVERVDSFILVSRSLRRHRDNGCMTINDPF